MSDTVYLAFDLYHPASYVPRADGNRPAAYASLDERYSHDAGWCYAILQPFLIASGGSDDSPSLLTYLREWNNARLAEPGAVRFLDEATIEGLRAANAPVSVTPVPFPADIVLGFTATWAGGGTIDVARDPSDGTFAFPQAAWPEFAGRNHMPVPILQIAHLTDAQKAELIAWSYGLMQTLVRKAGMPVLDAARLADLVAAKRVTALEARVLTLLLSGRPMTTPTAPKPPVPLDAFAAWQPHLALLLGPLFEKTLWGNRDLRNEPHLNPQTFRYTREALLRSEHGLAMMGPIPPSSYHRWLIEQMTLVAQEDARKAQDPNDRSEHQAPAALGRLFGFGERLRFPKIVNPDAERDFMIVQPAVTDSPGWFVTNAHSLLGQVFRVGPFDAAPADLGFQLASLTVATKNVMTDAARQALQAQFDQAHRERARLAADGRTFGGRLARLGEDRVFFLPRNARGVALDVANPTGMALYAVPGSLLDLLVQAPRTEAPAGSPGSNLTKANGQRLRLAATDLFQQGSYATWNKVRRFTRVKVRLDRIPLAAAPPQAAAYEVTLSIAMADDIDGLHAEAAANLRSAALWVSVNENTQERLKAFPLSDAVHSSGEAPFRAIVLDRTGELTQMLPARGLQAPANAADGPGTALPQEQVVVDLVWPAAGIADEHLAPSERFNLVAAADPADVPLFILGEEFEHRVTRSADRLTSPFGLTLSPVPPMTKAFEADPDASQPILGHFANFNKLRVDLVAEGRAPLTLNHPDALVPAKRQPPDGVHFPYDLTHQFSEEVRQSLDDSETNRYTAYRDAGIEWRICGQIEHQYSHKLPLDGGDALRLPLSSPIRNLAALSVEQQGNKHPVYALSFDIEPPAAAGAEETLRLTLDHRFLAAAAAASIATPAALRPLYEALFDLVAAVQSSSGGISAVLRLEVWNFDSTKRATDPRTVANADAAAEFPDIAASMRFDGGAEYVLDRNDIGPFVNLLGADLKAFQGNVTGATASPVTVIGLASPRWRWSTAGGAPPLPLRDTTNAVRLMLTVRRDDSRAIGAEYVQRDEQFTPLLAQTVRENPELTAFAGLAFDGLRGAARAQLTQMLQPSEPLRLSAEWVRAIDASREHALESRLDKDRGLKLMGEAYPFMNFPDDLARGVPAPVRLFHVPFGFLPLREHPAFGDPQTTFEFAEYLVNLLAALLHGKRPEEAVIDVEASLESSVDHCANLRRLIDQPGGLADAMLANIERVDAPGGTDPAFQEVDRLVAATETDRRAALRALFVADPAVFVKAKAIAAGLFDPGTFSPQLFAVQLRKRIRDGITTPAVVSEDTDRFTFNRFFGTGANRFLVDVLDDRSYDDDYEVEGAEGRTGEDVLEDRNRFDDPAATSRSVQVDVVHYNPDWVIERQGQRVQTYRLPSRRFPRTPKPIAPRGSEHQRTMLPRADISRGLDAQFASALSAAMPPAIELTPAEAGGPPLQAHPRDGSRAAADGEQVPGWHHLDSYISHYYFAVEPDEEEQFINDVFEITVQRLNAAPPSIPPVPAAEFTAITPLQQWFVYHRRKEEAERKDNGAAGPAVVAPAAKLTTAGILAEAEKWIVTAPAEGPFAGARLLTRRDDRIESDATVLYSLASGIPRLAAPAGGLSNPNPALVNDPPFGTVVAAELMDFPGPGGTSVLHLAVLDNVWSYQRVRVRVLRNGIDVNGDKRVDLNPAFGTTSRFSEWVNYGREVVTLDAQQDRFPPPVAVLRPTLDRDTWLNATTERLPFGPIIRNAVTAEFTDAVTGQPRTFWHQRHVLGADVHVSAVILQPIEDAHPRQRGTVSVEQSEKARGDVLTKQILPLEKGPDSDRLTSQISKADVLTRTPMLRVTWWKDGRLPVLHVTWPIAW